MSPAVDGSCRQPVKTQRILRRIKCIHGSSKVNADESRALSNASSARMVITLPQRFSTAPFAVVMLALLCLSLHTTTSK